MLLRTKAEKRQTNFHMNQLILRRIENVSDEEVFSIFFNNIEKKTTNRLKFVSNWFPRWKQTKMFVFIYVEQHTHILYLIELC